MNTIPRILSTLTLIAFGHAAHAATVSIETDQTAWVYLNGQLLEYPPGETTLKAEKLRAGTYEIVVRNWRGKKVGESTLVMPKDGDAVLSWSAKSLKVVSAPDQPKPKDDGSGVTTEKLAELLGEGGTAATAEGDAAPAAEGDAAPAAEAAPGMTLAPPPVTADGAKTLTTPAAAPPAAAPPAAATPAAATPAAATPAATPTAAAIIAAAIATGKAVDAPAATAGTEAPAASGMTQAEPAPVATPTKVLVTAAPEAPAPVAVARKGSIEISGLEKDKARIWVDDQQVPYFEQTKSFVAVLLPEGEHTVKVAIGKKMAFTGKLEVRGDATNSCAVTPAGTDWDTKCSWKTTALGPKQD